MKQYERRDAFRNITVVGVGLIGGSFALAAKQRYPSVRITGVDTPAVLRRALKRGAIDIGSRSVESAVRSADLVVLAAPVSVILRSLPRIARNISPNTIVTDTGSVKRAIVEKANGLFRAGNFIGGHPMTGSEFSGIDAAQPLLFQNAVYILTPAASSSRRSVQKIAQFVAGLDARVCVLDAHTHDSIVAAVSHLPQLAAVALMNTAGRRHPDASKHLALAAGGFRDMTRIASSPFDVWKDILATNKKEIEIALRAYRQELQKIESAVRSNPSRLAAEFRTSRSLRARIPRSMKGFLAPLVELSVFVDDRPGQLARLTSALARKRINIKDLELLKVREGRGGTFRLSFENRAVAAEAADVLRRAGFDVGKQH